MKKLALLLTTLLFFVACTDTNTYYDADWEKTTKENAVYYRELCREAKGIWPIHDYYITGEKQFIGGALDSLGTTLEGDATWYFKTGSVQNKVSYNNGKVVGYYTGKNDSKGSEKEGWDEGDLVFIAYSKAANVVDAVKHSTSTHERYYTDTSLIASQHTSNVGYEDKFSFTLYLDKKGDTIGRLSYNKKSEKWNGKEVLFYKVDNEDVTEITTIKEINTYTNGIKTRSCYYNTNEKLVAEGTFKGGNPFNGTFLKDTCQFTKMQAYENGNLLTEITFNTNDEQIGKVSFKNQVPNTGVYYNCSSMQTYKNGELHGKSIQYLGEDSENIEFEFTFKNGIKHGNYHIYQDESLLLEKGKYKNGVQTDEVIYYHNSTHLAEGNNYYLKASVKSKKNNPFITELKQYNLDDNALLKTFVFQQNTTDKFTYINNGYHEIHEKDLNSDGVNDLQIRYYHQMHDIETNTYYLFNSVTNKYEHLAMLDDSNTIDINSDKNTIKASYGDDYDENSTYVMYGFSKSKLIKQLEIQEVYHNELDTLLVTQVFPVQLDKYPLLADDLPSLTFTQQDKNTKVVNTHQTLTLKKESFSITLPGLIDTKPYPFGFRVKITASYDEAIFKKARINNKDESTSIFSKGTTMAVSSKTSLFIEDSGNNVFYYVNKNDHNLKIQKNINDKVQLFQLTIDEIEDPNNKRTIGQIDQPIYLVVYINKNDNLKIDANEIYYLTLNFKE